MINAQQKYSLTRWIYSFQAIVTLQQSSARMWVHSQTHNDDSASLWQSPTVKWSQKMWRIFSLTSQHVLGRCYNKWPLTQLLLKLQLRTMTVSLLVYCAVSLWLSWQKAVYLRRYDILFTVVEFDGMLATYQKQGLIVPWLLYFVVIF